MRDLQKVLLNCLQIIQFVVYYVCRLKENLNKKMKYEVIDNYDGYDESLGVFDTKQEARARIRKQVQDTDGECSCYIVKLHEKDSD